MASWLTQAPEPLRREGVTSPRDFANVPAQRGELAGRREADFWPQTGRPETKCQMQVECRHFVLPQPLAAAFEVRAAANIPGAL
jgi:hypothetical protein